MNSIKRFCWAVVGFWLAAAGAQSADLTDAVALESFMAGTVETALKEHDVPGATLSIVHDGRLLLARGYGYANAALTRRVNPERTLFRVGSTSKLFTYMSIMQLMEQGKIDLDTDVNSYLEGTGVEVPNEYGIPVTLNHIFSHRPGLEDGSAGYLFVYDPTRIKPLGVSLAAHTPRQIRPPGTQPSYSNWGIAVMGLVVQNVSGMAFNEYVEKHIYAPLGMNHSTFREPLPESIAQDMSEGMRRVDGAYQALDFEYIANFGPAGAMSSSANDMAIFMLTLLQQGEMAGRRILQPATAVQMLSQIQTNHPGLPGMGHGFYEQRINGVQLVGHGGATEMFHTNMLISPDQDFGVFMSFNGVNGRAAAGTVMHQFMDRYFPASAVEAVTPPADFKQRASAYTGQYRTMRHSYSTLEKLSVLFSPETSVSLHETGTLVISGYPGGKTYRFVEVDKHLFRRVDGEEQVAFEEDESGNVAYLHVQDVPYRSWYRLAWWETNSSQFTFMGVALAVFALVFLRSLIRGRSLLSEIREQGLSRLALPVMSLSFLLFAGGMLQVISGALFKTGFPGHTAALLVLPLLGLALAIIASWCTVQDWRRKEGAATVRLLNTVVVGLAILFVACLYYWNAIGWHYF